MLKAKSPLGMAARDIQAGTRQMDGLGDLCILRPQRGEGTTSTAGPAHCWGREGSGGGRYLEEAGAEPGQPACVCVQLGQGGGPLLLDPEPRCYSEGHSAAFLPELSESVRLRQTACGLMPCDCVLFD